MAFKEDVAKEIKRLLNEGGEENFLIVSAGDIYVQFTSSNGESSVNCEVVSNRFLPDDLYLERPQVIQLNELGFESPSGADDGCTNFNRPYNVNTDERLEKLVEDVYFVFFEIFKLSLDTEFKLDLTLQ